LDLVVQNYAFILAAKCFQQKGKKCYFPVDDIFAQLSIVSSTVLARLLVRIQGFTTLGMK